MNIINKDVHRREDLNIVQGDLRSEAEWMPPICEMLTETNPLARTSRDSGEIICDASLFSSVCENLIPYIPLVEKNKLFFSKIIKFFEKATFKLKQIIIYKKK